MAVTHISEAEAASDFAGLMERVRAGEAIVIESNAQPVAVLMPAEPRGRMLSESLRLARAHSFPGTLDGGFATDLEAVINSHAEPLKNPWE